MLLTICAPGVSAEVTFSLSKEVGFGPEDGDVPMLGMGFGLAVMAAWVCIN